MQERAGVDYPGPQAFPMCVKARLGSPAANAQTHKQEQVTFFHCRRMTGPVWRGLSHRATSECLYFSQNAGPRAFCSDFCSCATLCLEGSGRVCCNVCIQQRGFGAMRPTPPFRLGGLLLGCKNHGPRGPPSPPSPPHVGCFKWLGIGRNTKPAISDGICWLAGSSFHSLRQDRVHDPPLGKGGSVEVGRRPLGGGGSGGSPRALVSDPEGGGV